MKLSIKKNIRNYQKFYNIVNMVYYKLDSSHKWKGTRKVLGQDEAALFLHHGVKYIKVHICCVQLTHTNPKSLLENSNIESQQTNSATYPQFKINLLKMSLNQLKMKLNMNHLQMSIMSMK